MSEFFIGAIFMLTAFGLGMSVYRMLEAEAEEKRQRFARVSRR